MFRFAVVLLAVTVGHVVSAATTTVGVVPQLDGRIVGGVGTDIRQFPHQISMRYNGNHRCGGSIYSANIVVSAAHCVTGVDASMLSIAAGSTLLSEDSVELPVAYYIMHSKYSTINNDYDVAILVLRGAFEFSESIQPIALATKRPAEGATVTVTGWGTLVENGSIPDQLQRVDVDIVDNSVCRKAYSILLTSRMLCAGVNGGGKDACQGDSGGPLVHNNELLGIVSWGIGCARENYPGVYASVPDLYDWIVATASENTIRFA